MKNLFRIFVLLCFVGALNSCTAEVIDNQEQSTGVEGTSPIEQDNDRED